MAQLVLLDFKLILDNHSNHNISATHSQGRGRRGPGCGPCTGRGGPAPGNLCRGEGGGGHYEPGGRGRGGARGSRSNRFTHVTTLGGQALNMAMLSDSSWDTISISRGDHDFLTKKQVHVKKAWYTNEEYIKLKPLERRKLYITQEANGSKSPKSIAAVSVNHLSKYFDSDQRCWRSSNLC